MGALQFARSWYCAEWGGTVSLRVDSDYRHKQESFKPNEMCGSPRSRDTGLFFVLSCRFSRGASAWALRQGYINRVTSAGSLRQGRFGRGLRQRGFGRGASAEGLRQRGFGRGTSTGSLQLGRFGRGASAGGFGRGASAGGLRQGRFGRGALRQGHFNFFKIL